MFTAYKKKKEGFRIVCWPRYNANQRSYPNQQGYAQKVEFPVPYELGYKVWVAAKKGKYLAISKEELVQSVARGEL